MNGLPKRISGMEVPLLTTQTTAGFGLPMTPLTPVTPITPITPVTPNLQVTTHTTPFPCLDLQVYSNTFIDTAGTKNGTITPSPTMFGSPKGGIAIESPLGGTGNSSLGLSTGMGIAGTVINTNIPATNTPSIGIPANPGMRINANTIPVNAPMPVSHTATPTSYTNPMNRTPPFSPHHLSRTMGHSPSHPHHGHTQVHQVPQIPQASQIPQTVSSHRPQHRPRKIVTNATPCTCCKPKPRPTSPSTSVPFLYWGYHPYQEVRNGRYYFRPEPRWMEVPAPGSPPSGPKEGM